MLNHDQEIRFAKARRRAIEREFSNLNPEQRKAALATEGPLLLLAGAGSGKTTVLIHRVANLMKYGRGSDSAEAPGFATEDDLAFLEEYARTGQGDKGRQEQLCRLEPAAPWTILAITFTNKAAGELKERLTRMLGPRPTTSGPAPSTPPARGSSGGTSTSWVFPLPSPSTTQTTPCGSSRTA